MMSRSKKNIVLTVLLLLLTACGKTELTDAEYMQRAQTQYSNGELRAAVIELKNVLQRSPEHLDARYFLGKLYIDLGDGVSAEKELRYARRLNIPDEQWVVYLGKSLLLQSKFEALLDELKVDDLLANDQLAASLLALQGDAWLGVGKPEKARESFRASGARDKHSVSAILGLAKLALFNSDYEAAENLLSKASEIDADSPELALVKGALAMAQLEYEKAIKIYRGVVDGASGNVLTGNQMLAQQGVIRGKISQAKNDEALVEIEVLTRANANSPLLDYFRGLIAYRKKQYPDALEYLQKAEQLAPSFPPVHLMLGAVNFAQEHFGQAEVYLARYVAMEPTDVAGKRLLAVTRLNLDHPESALEVLRPMVGEIEDDATLLSMVGRAAIQAGEYNEGVTYLKRAVKVAPARQTTNLREQLASAYLFGGEPDKALEELEQQLGGENEFQSRALIVLALVRKDERDKAIKAAIQLTQEFPAESKAFHMLGSLYQLSGDHKQAIQQYQRSVKINPEFIPAVRNLAVVNFLLGDLAAARKYFERLRSIDSDNIIALLSLSQIEEREGNSQKAKAWVEMAVDKAPDDFRPYVFLGRSALKENNLEKAVVFARKAASAAPDSLPAQNFLGDVLVRTGALDEALGVFEKLVEVNPDNVNLNLKVGVVGAQLGYDDKAGESLKKVLSLNPELYPAISGLALVEAKRGDYEAAMSLVAGIRERQPEKAFSYALEGDLLMQQKKYVAAANSYRSAFERQKVSELVVKRYRALKLAGNTRGASWVLSDWFDKHSEDVRVAYLLAGEHIAGARYKKAVVVYQHIIRARPDSVPAMNNMAWALLELKDERAVEVAARAYQLRGNDADVIDTYGWVLVQMGDVDHGVKLLRDAVKINPEKGEIQYHLAVGLNKLGRNPQEVIDILQNLEQAGSDFSGRSEAKALLEQLQ